MIRRCGIGGVVSGSWGKEGRKDGAGPQVVVQRLPPEHACLAIAMVSINTSEKAKNDKKDGEKGREKGRERYGHMPLVVARYAG